MESKRHLRLGLRNLTDEQAENLSQVKYLFLDRLESLTDNQAKSLSKVRYLDLRGLKEISVVQAKWLSSLNESNLAVPHEIKIKIWNAKNKSPSEF